MYFDCPPLCAWIARISEDQSESWSFSRSQGRKDRLNSRAQEVKFSETDVDSEDGRQFVILVFMCGEIWVINVAKMPLRQFAQPAWVF